MGVAFIILIALLALLITVFGFLLIVIIFTEKKSVFSADLEPAWVDPKDFGAVNDELEDVELTTEDGVTLRGWFYRTFLQKLITKMQKEQAENDEKGKEKAADEVKDNKPLLCSPTILYLHGNSGNISHRFPLFRKFANGTQFNLFVVDYRGYGKSDGDPSEAGLKKDAEAMLHALLKRDDIDKSRIIVYGQGLGGSLAIHLATQESTKHLFQAMVIENTFTSIRDMATLFLPAWLSKLSVLVKNNFDSLALLKENKLEIPALFIATAEDEVVPPNHMKKLFRVAKRNATPECKDNVKMIRYNGTEHHNVPSLNEDAFYKNLLEWSCKVLLQNSVSEEEMRELEQGFKELGETDDGVQEEEPESIGSDDEENEGEQEELEGDDDKDDDDGIVDVPQAELRKRAKGKSSENDAEAQD